MERMDALRIALRVLAAVTEYRQPSESDVEVLRGVMPLCAQYSPDDLASEVIQQILKGRARARTKGTS